MLRYPKQNLHYTRNITPKRVTSGWVLFCGLAPGQHSSDETSQRWLTVAGSVSGFAGAGMEPRPSAPIVMSLATTLSDRCLDPQTFQYYPVFRVPGIDLVFSFVTYLLNKY